jgi:hypothetical protein
MVGSLSEASFAELVRRFGSKWGPGQTLAQAAYAEALTALGGNTEHSMPVVQWAAEAGPQVRTEARAFLEAWESANRMPGWDEPRTEGEAEAHRSSCQLALAWIGEEQPPR